MREPVQRRLAFDLAADVGLFAVTGADEEGSLERLRAHSRQLADPKIGEHYGLVVELTGCGETDRAAAELAEAQSLPQKPSPSIIYGNGPLSNPKRPFGLVRGNRSSCPTPPIRDTSRESAQLGVCGPSRSVWLSRPLRHLGRSHLTTRL